MKEWFRKFKSRMRLLKVHKERGCRCLKGEYPHYYLHIDIKI